MEFYFFISIFLAYVTSGIHLSSLKKVSPFGPAVWPAREHVYESLVLLYRRYLRLMTLGCKIKGVRKSEFVANIQF